MPTDTKPSFDLLLIHGAGGHAAVVADAAMGMGWFAKLGATDANPLALQTPLLQGMELRTVDAWIAVSLAKTLGVALHVAIGHAQHRRKEMLAWQSRLPQASWPSIVHASAQCSAHAQLSQACFVAALSVVAARARIGTGCIVNHGAIIDHDCQVGDFSHIAPRACLGGAVTVGADCMIGAGAVVLPGVTIGQGSTVGAGAVVTRDVAPGSKIIGIPARSMSSGHATYRGAQA